MKDSTNQLGKAIVFLVVLTAAVTVVARYWLPITVVATAIFALRYLWWRTNG